MIEYFQLHACIMKQTRFKVFISTYTTEHGDFCYLPLTPSKFLVSFMYLF